MLTAKQKADWADRFTSDEWKMVMAAKAFPAVMDALTCGDLEKAERIMRETLAEFTVQAAA